MGDLLNIAAEIMKLLLFILNPAFLAVAFVGLFGLMAAGIGWVFCWLMPGLATGHGLIAGCLTLLCLELVLFSMVVVQWHAAWSESVTEKEEDDGWGQLDEEEIEKLQELARRVTGPGGGGPRRKRGRRGEG